MKFLLPVFCSCCMRDVKIKIKNGVLYCRVVFSACGVFVLYFFTCGILCYIFPRVVFCVIFFRM